MDRYVKDGFQLTSPAMTDRLTAVVDDLEKNKLGKFKGWAVPGKTLDSAASGSGSNGLPAGGAPGRRADGGARRDSIQEILRYLNRLSDLCWLLARYAEHLHDEAESTGGKR